MILKWTLNKKFQSQVSMFNSQISWSLSSTKFNLSKSLTLICSILREVGSFSNYYFIIKNKVYTISNQLYFIHFLNTIFIKKNQWYPVLESEKLSCLYLYTRLFINLYKNLDRYQTYLFIMYILQCIYTHYIVLVLSIYRVQ